MTNKDIFKDTFPQDRQIGGSIIDRFIYNHMNLYRRTTFPFFQGNVIKYVCRYKNKNGIQDLEKVIHYCELEIKKMKDMKKK